MQDKPVLNVVCAVIFNEKKILAVRRKKGERMEGLWEFPGGKIMEKETPEESLIREIREELLIGITPELRLETVDFEYKEFRIRLIPFQCQWDSSPITLTVHDRFEWLAPGELKKVNWSGADLVLVEALIKRYG